MRIDLIYGVESAAEDEVTLHLANADSVAVSEAGWHATGKAAIIKERSVGTTKVFQEVTTGIREDAGVLARHVGSRVVVGKVEVRKDLAREAATTYVEGIFENTTLPKHTIGTQHLYFAGRSASEGGTAPPAEVGLALVGRTTDHANPVG